MYGAAAALPAWWTKVHYCRVIDSISVRDTDTRGRSRNARVPRLNLLPQLSALSNVELPLLYADVQV